MQTSEKIAVLREQDTLADNHMEGHAEGNVIEVHKGEEHGNAEVPNLLQE